MVEWSREVDTVHALYQRCRILLREERKKKKNNTKIKKTRRAHEIKYFFYFQGAGAVTHQSNQAEYRLEFQWQPTADTTGNVIFM